MNKPNVLKGFALGALITLSGCAVNETATVEVDPSGEKQQIIVSNSGFLAANLVIANSAVGKAGDLLKAQATIKNQSGSDLNFQYKFKWLDKDGFEVGVDSRPWQPITITGHESKSVQALAPNPSVTQFQILVQD